MYNLVKQQQNISPTSTAQPGVLHSYNFFGTVFKHLCSRIYVNIKSGCTIPTLLNQVQWKLLCLAIAVIPLYTRCRRAVSHVYTEWKMILSAW